LASHLVSSAPSLLAFVSAFYSTPVTLLNPVSRWSERYTDDTSQTCDCSQPDAAIANCGIRICLFPSTVTVS